MAAIIPVLFSSFFSMRYTKSMFDFTFKSYGAYEVRFTFPVRGDYYVGIVKDMTLIDSTKNEEEPLQSALKQLKFYLECRGAHYTKYGDRIS